MRYGLNGALHVVEDRQQITGKLRSAILFGFAAVPLGPLARIFRIGQRPHELGLELVTLGLKREDHFIRFRFFQGSGIGDVDQLVIVCRFLCLCVTHRCPRSAIKRPTNWAV